MRLTLARDTGKAKSYQFFIVLLGGHEIGGGSRLRFIRMWTAR